MISARKAAKGKDKLDQLEDTELEWRREREELR